jgi:hypothetical protein
VIALIAGLLLALASAHLDLLRRALRRSSVVRVRVRRDDVEGEPDQATVRVGAELTLVDEGAQARVERALPITGLPALQSSSPPSAWIDASVVARAPWAGATTYRDGLPTPPVGARIIAGGMDSAMAQARLDDLERGVMLACLIVPVITVVSILGA